MFKQKASDTEAKKLDMAAEQVGAKHYFGCIFIPAGAEKIKEVNNEIGEFAAIHGISHLTNGVIRLHDGFAVNGRFDRFEAILRNHGVPFVRMSSGANDDEAENVVWAVGQTEYKRVGAEEAEALAMKLAM